MDGADRSGDQSSATKSGGANNYAVIVRGANDDLTQADLRRRLADEVINDNGEIRLRAVRNVRDGVVVEGTSSADRQKLVESQAVRDAGLRLETP